jgi:uncharacterized protein
MLDMAGLRQLVVGLDYHPLFVTVSGAHLYGFPSPDSDIDLRGCHQMPLREIVGLTTPVETREQKLDCQGIEVELVSHEVAKYLRLLLKNNGYILEQVFSPLVVFGQEFLDQLRPLAERCITRHHYHHYRGFLETERKLLTKQEPKKLKAILYAYRVVLTGIHLLRTGKVEANLLRLADVYELRFLHGLAGQKSRELAPAQDLNWLEHEQRLAALEQMLERAYQESKLPEERDRAAVNQFLVELRVGQNDCRH